MLIFSIRNFDFRSSLITWIYKITVNECFDYLRKKKVRKLVYESDMSEDEVRRVENSEPALDRGARADSSLARRDYVVKLMDRVSDEEERQLMMPAAEGYSVEELSGMLKMNENTVKVKLVSGAPEAGEGIPAAGRRTPWVRMKKRTG